MAIWGVVPAVEHVIRGIPDKIPELQLGGKAVVFQLEKNFAQFGLEIAKFQPAEKIAKLQVEKKFAELSKRIAELKLGRMWVIFNKRARLQRTPALLPHTPAVPVRTPSYPIRLKHRTCRSAQFSMRMAERQSHDAIRTMQSHNASRCDFMNQSARFNPTRQ